MFAVPVGSSSFSSLGKGVTRSNLSGTKTQQCIAATTVEEVKDSKDSGDGQAHTSKRIFRTLDLIGHDARPITHTCCGGSMYDISHTVTASVQKVVDITPIVRRRPQNICRHPAVCWHHAQNL
jgi:hypothetical protein